MAAMLRLAVVIGEKKPTHLLVGQCVLRHLGGGI
jgi:hypothetical protein